MAELRKDLTSRTWVIIAQERGKRPHDFKLTPDLKATGECPFCMGHEQQTPPEVLALGRPAGASPNTPGWQVRVVPNKFPALRVEAGEGEEGDAGWLRRPPYEASLSFYPSLPGVGAHEVLIESPVHEATFGSHTPAQLEAILQAMVLRIQDLRGDRRLQYIQIFKNTGRAAGASLEHTHCQLIATPIIPPVPTEELIAAYRYYVQNNQTCLYCTLLAREEAEGVRVVTATPHFLVFCPYASRFPYELWFIPRRHAPGFASLRPEERTDLSRLLRATVRRLEEAFTTIPYNLLWHTAPLQEEEAYGAYYHWHLELLPRLTIMAGFELGSGIFINPTAPELAARELREVKENDGEFTTPGI